jgi:hypothetical protein
VALLLPVAIVLFPSFVVLAAAMVPTVVAWLVDPGNRRYLVATVGSLNFSGSLYFLVRLWSDNHDLAHALAVLHDAMGWLVAYGAAAIGYGVYYIMPTLSAGFVRLRAEAQLARLEREMRAVVDEWGEEVSRPAQE